MCLRQGHYSELSKTFEPSFLGEFDDVGLGYIMLAQVVHIRDEIRSYARAVRKPIISPWNRGSANGIRLPERLLVLDEDRLWAL